MLRKTILVVLAIVVAVAMPHATEGTKTLRRLSDAAILNRVDAAINAAVADVETPEVQQEAEVPAEFTQASSLLQVDDHLDLFHASAMVEDIDEDKVLDQMNDYVAAANAPVAQKEDIDDLKEMIADSENSFVEADGQAQSLEDAVKKRSKGKKGGVISKILSRISCKMHTKLNKLVGKSKVKFVQKLKKKFKKHYGKVMSALGKKCGGKKAAKAKAKSMCMKPKKTRGKKGKKALKVFNNCKAKEAKAKAAAAKKAAKAKAKAAKKFNKNLGTKESTESIQQRLDEVMRAHEINYTGVDPKRAMKYAKVIKGAKIDNSSSKRKLLAVENELDEAQNTKKSDLQMAALVLRDQDKFQTTFDDTVIRRHFKAGKPTDKRQYRKPEHE